MREDAIVNFVTFGDIFVTYGDISNNSEDIDLYRSIEVSPLAGCLLPRQAIALEEQVILTKTVELEKEPERNCESRQ